MSRPIFAGLTLYVLAFPVKVEGMTVQTESSHAKIVLDWEAQNCAGLDPARIAQIYGIAIQVVERRSLATLSSITVKVVANRVLNESLEKFPLLSRVTLEEHRMNTSRLVEESSEYELDLIRTALRHLLTELLTVLGNITADVLTIPLHRELMKITCESMPKLLEVRSREKL